MDEIAHFVPGTPAPLPARGLGAYLPAMPEGVASAYIAALTQPGDLVLDPFCQTGRVLRESTALERRALGTNLNPVATQWIETLLWPPDARLTTAALVRLGDTPRGDVTLRQHIMNLYATRCPTCNKNATAELFVWERDIGEPVEKRVRCAVCRQESAGPTDEADIAAAHRFEPRGMAYWFALERATPDESDMQARERIAAVVEAYTARTLAALADILRKYDAASPPDQSALAPILLAALESALALHSAEEERPRPRSLKIPPRFVEHNIWLAMEDALAACQTIEPAPRRSANVAALLADRAPSACLVTRGGRDLGKIIPPGSANLILTVPPQPDPTFWALSAVWAAWLWGPKSHTAAQSHIVESVRLLLARRRADLDWWWRGLAQVLGALVPTLTKGGHVVLVSSEADESVLTGLMLAGASVGLTLDHALIEPQCGLRVMWHTTAPTPARELDIEALAVEIGEKARHAAGEIIRERGEPTPWPFVYAAIQTELAQAELLRTAARMPEGGPLPVEFVEKAALEANATAAHSPVYRLEDKRNLWWLTDPSRVAPPLSDRVEAAIRELLTQSMHECAESELIAQIYARFPAALTPEYAYIRLCLESYATQIRAGVWALRDEDIPAAREAEIASLRGMLIELGQRLNCQVSTSEGHVLWAEEHRPLFNFVFSVTAELSTHLLTKRPPRGRPVLVLPGGRGALAHYKLGHDVRLRAAAADAGWTFLKFRQLRNLVGQPLLDRKIFEDALGLDPLIEQEGRQMALL